MPAKRLRLHLYLHLDDAHTPFPSEAELLERPESERVGLSELPRRLEAYIEALYARDGILVGGNDEVVLDGHYAVRVRSRAFGPEDTQSADVLEVAYELIAYRYPTWPAWALDMPEDTAIDFALLRYHLPTVNSYNGLTKWLEENHIRTWVQLGRVGARQLRRVANFSSKYLPNIRYLLSEHDVQLGK